MGMLAYLVKMAFKGIKESDFMKRQEQRIENSRIEKEKTKSVLGQDEINQTLTSKEND